MEFYLKMFEAGCQQNGRLESDKLSLLQNNFKKKKKQEQPKPTLLKLWKTVKT